MNSTNKASIDINIFDLLKSLWRKKFFILFIATIFGLMTLLTNIFIFKPKFVSTTSIYVVNKSNDNAISNQDIQTATFLVKDYKEIMASSEVLSTVIKKENLQLSQKQLAKAILVTVPIDTRVLAISVKDSNPKEAYEIVQAVRDVSIEKIKSMTKVNNIQIIDKGNISKRPTSPHIKRNTVIGFVIGGALATLLVISRSLSDNRVRHPEDIEEGLGMTLLGVVPDNDKL